MSAAVPSSRTSRPARIRKIGYWGLSWLGLAAAAAAWQLASGMAGSTIFPGFGTTVSRAWQLIDGPELTRDLIPSILRTLAGFAISAVLGITLGLVTGYYRAAREWTSAVFDFLRSLPTPLLIPVALVIFGLGGKMVVAVIVTAAVWPVLINTANATSALEPTLVDTARILGLRGPAFMGRVVLPAVSPQIFAGLRVALSVSLAVMVVSEILGGGSGIGYFIANAQQSFAITDSYAGVIILCLLGWAFDTLFLFVERRLLAWQHGTVGGEPHV
ncbi:MAG TPA: ABC transporter permease [Solirubrobacteraceae bacterium]|nr:ABC transporter permease [Solirubrobacteraceae bacterium]